jgi:undecaprenyl-phosphate galactose phosphotransferase/putative colanic acid biosynthesis UDP-glucose lipid carrier transferase
MSQISEFRSDFQLNTAPLGGRGVSAINNRTAGLLVGVTDVVSIVLTCVASSVAYQAYLGSVGEVQPVVGTGLLSAALFVLLMRARNLYSAHALASFSRQLRGGAVALAVALLGLLSLLFLLKVSAEFSRGAMLIFGLSSTMAFIATRFVAARQITSGWQRGTLAGRRALLIGAGDELAGSTVHAALDQYGATGVECFSLQEHSPGCAVDIQTVDDAIDFAVANQIELILLLLPWSGEEKIRLICERLRALPLPVLLLPDRVVSSVLGGSGKQSDRQLAIEVQRAPLTSTEMLAKRIFDVVLASFSLLLVSVLMAVVAVAIRLESPGPVIFRQRRRGFNGRPFTIFKFRTMRVMEDGNDVRQAARNDPRTTSIGRMLRMSSIDELPQLVNVLRGEMSIVGPRPHAVAHDNEYNRVIENYALRHHMKPGITGWAQVHGLRGQANWKSMQKRVELDLWYINNWSLLLDLRIVARTFVEVMRGRNAW